MRGRVLFLNRFYAPDVAATAQLLADLAEALAGEGWEVWVIASRSAYSESVPSMTKPQQDEGIFVRRVGGSRFGRANDLGRAIDYLTYMLFALFAALRIPKPTVVVAMSDPPFVIGLACLIGKLRRAPVCFWVQDVYPQLAARLGLLDEGRSLYRILRWVSSQLLAMCDLVIALGPRMRESLLIAGAPANRTIYIHNWADADAIEPVLPEDNPFVERHGLLGRFVVLYSGNAGRAHTFSATCEVMRRLRAVNRIRFLFIGGGAKSAAIRSFASAEKLENVQFLDYLPRASLRFSLSSASVALVTEEPSVRGLLVPSKTYGILACGRPIIFVGHEDSDVARIIFDAQCGFVVRHDDADALERAVIELSQDPVTCARMGSAARKASERFYNRARSTTAWADVLAQVGDSGHLYPWSGTEGIRFSDEQRGSVAERA